MVGVEVAEVEEAGCISNGLDISWKEDVPKFILVVLLCDDFFHILVCEEFQY